MDTLRVFATVEKAALRWKGPRGSVAAPTNNGGSDAEELATRMRRFLLRNERQEQHAQELLEKRKHAARAVRQALKEKANQLIISRPLRRFGMKLMVRLIHHTYDSDAKSEKVTQRMVVMEDGIKLESLDEWVKTCLGISKGAAAKKEASGKEGTALKYQYVSINGHPTVIDSKLALQNWLDSMWAVHPPTIHAFDNDGLRTRRGGSNLATPSPPPPSPSPRTTLRVLIAVVAPVHSRRGAGPDLEYPQGL